MIDPISAATSAAISVGATKAIEKTASNFVDKISIKFAKDKYAALRMLLDKGLPSYLEANYAKCETLKTLLNRNDPVALADCFVAPDFSSRDKKVTSEEFLEQVNRSDGKYIITGLAGSGKSVFLKYSFRNIIEKGHSYYPIFFELRSLNRADIRKGLLLAEIFSSIQQSCESFTRAHFDFGLRSGAFYFLLDGFDELNQNIRDQISEEIMILATTHSKCALLVTSRPSDEFVSWEGFTQANLLPFDLEKALTYISKLNFDEEKKSDFLADLKGGLFEKNQDFLSNPLLCAMMLLTYDSFGEIPEKRHIFYAKCFDVLAREHDASKGRYKRELFSGLAMDQIEKTFMFFCAFSYVERNFSFSDDQMEQYVKEAVEACALEANTADVIKDFRESISIMERVGLLYEFAHRSFQEYFYARFVIADRKLTLEQKIGWLTSGFRSDDTLEMIADMDRSYFEDEFLLPNLIRLDKKLNAIDPMTNPAGVLSKFYSVVHTAQRSNAKGESGEPNIYYTLSDQRAHFFVRQALWKYDDEYSDGDRSMPYEYILDQSEIFGILDKNFGGEIKIHHTNNKKLILVESTVFACRIKFSISRLRRHLESKQVKRKKGLGSLMRKNYSETYQESLF